MEFDGTDDHVEIADDDIFSFTDGANDLPFSVQAWIMIGNIAADEGSIVGKFNGNTASEWLFWQDNGKLRVNLYTIKSTKYIRNTTNNVVLSNNTWHHVAATYDGSKDKDGLKLYVDGVLAASFPEASAGGNVYTGMANQDTAVRIGGDVSNALRFEKKIANVALFNKELTATEITELYNKGRVLDLSTFSDYDSVLAWWKLGDGDTLPTAIDSKGGRNGTVTSATLVDEPGAARPGIFVTDGFSTENQRYLNLRIEEGGNSGVPQVTVWLKSYAMGLDRWGKLGDFNGAQNSVVNHIIDVNGADRAIFIWDNTGTDVKISAGCSTF